MPNWVENTVTITGDETLVAEIGARLRAPVPPGQEDAVFSFWNIVAPTDLDRYHSTCDSEGIKDPDNWYNWNVRNWGCKWDASSVSVDVESTRLVYNFTTPWSPPARAMELLAEQYPKATIHIRFVEEQGWGGEMVGNGENWEEIDSWDTPSTHEETMSAFGYCWACEDTGNLYPDCPDAVASQSHHLDIELLGECRWCEINEDGRYDDCPEE